MKKIEEIETKNLLHFEGNPRFDTVVQEGLFQDIEKHGVLVPILVSPAKADGKYEVIDGERRRISAVELKIPKLTCIIQDMDEQTKWQRAYDLNILNRPFTSMEMAKNFYLRKKRFLLSDKNLVSRSGGTLKKTQINLMVCLNKLPEEIQTLVHNKSLDLLYFENIRRMDLSMIEKGRSVHEIFKAEGVDLNKKKLAKKLARIEKKKEKKIAVSATEKQLNEITRGNS